MEVIIKRSGVTKVETGYESGITVNGEDLLFTLSEAIRAAEPMTDHYSNFASTVTITIEFTGDMKIEA